MPEANVKKVNKKDPLVHLVRRTDLAWWKGLLIRIGGIFVGILFVCLLLLFNVGANPGDVIAQMFLGCFGNARRVWILFRDMCLLLLVTIALASAFKMKFWNLGGNGQILMGCFATILCMFYLDDFGVPDWAIVLIEIPSAILAGAIWAFIPAIFKAFFNTNESLFTLMMNYIAEGIVAIFLAAVITSGSGNMPTLDTGNLPAIYNQYLPIILVGTVLFIIMVIYLRFSKHGYELAVVGESMNTAKYIGINTKKVIIRTAVLSGALCGIAGLLIGAGIDHSITQSSADNLGFTAIMTAWLAHLNPTAMVGTCFLVSFLNRGIANVQTVYNITNDSVASIALGFVYFTILASEFFVTYRVIFRNHHPKDRLTILTGDLNLLPSEEAKGEAK